MQKQKVTYFSFFQQILLCNRSSVKGRKEILFKFQTTLDEVIDTSVFPTMAGGTIIWGPRGQQDTGEHELAQAPVFQIRRRQICTYFTKIE